MLLFTAPVLQVISIQYLKAPGNKNNANSVLTYLYQKSLFAIESQGFEKCRYTL